MGRRCFTVTGNFGDVLVAPRNRLGAFSLSYLQSWSTSSGLVIATFMISFLCDNYSINTISESKLSIFFQRDISHCRQHHQDGRTDSLNTTHPHPLPLILPSHTPRIIHVSTPNLWQRRRDDERLSNGDSRYAPTS